MTHGWDKVLLLVDGWDVRLVRLLADHLNTNTQLILSNNTQKAMQGEDWPGPRAACVYCLVDRLTGILSGYFCLIRSASALRFSTFKCVSLHTRKAGAGTGRCAVATAQCYSPKGCSSLNLERILGIYLDRVYRAKLTIGLWGANVVRSQVLQACL